MLGAPLPPSSTLCPTPPAQCASHPPPSLPLAPCLRAAQVLQAPNVKLFNATAVEDLIIRDDAVTGKRIGGVVTNWCVRGHGRRRGAVLPLCLAAPGTPPAPRAC